jgi:RNA polymerase sigma-32 factor
LKGQLKALDEGDLSPENVEKIATKLQVSADDVISMNRRLSGGDQSLNAPLRVDGDGEWQDWLEDESDNQEVVLGQEQEMDHRRRMLADAMHSLNQREQHILTERRLKDEPATLEDLSVEYGISRERVRQIEVRAFEKLQRAMRNAVIQENLASNKASQTYIEG